MHVEILLNNNLAGFVTPAVSRYGNVLYQSWPLGRLRELDPAASAWFSPPVPFCTAHSPLLAAASLLPAASLLSRRRLGRETQGVMGHVRHG